MAELVNLLKIEEANCLKDKEIAFLDNIVKASYKGGMSKFLKGHNKNKKKSNKKLETSRTTITKSRRKEEVVVVLSMGSKGTKIINAVIERELAKTLKGPIKVNRTNKRMW